MTSQEKQFLVKQLIEDCTSHLPKALRWYTDVNQPIKLIDDTLSEVIHAYCHNTRCGGSGGGGWDHVDSGEDKNSSHVQSYVCPDCGKKVVFFATECPSCGSKNRGKIPHDGRWGISASSHFKWYDELKEYRLQLIEPLTDDASCRQFRLRYWVLPKDSEHLNLYAKAQLESPKSNHINFQPLKVDFYLSNPILKYDGVLTIHENHTEFQFNFFDLNNQTPEEIPAEYAGANSQSVVESKTLGKERGEWVRN